MSGIGWDDYYDCPLYQFSEDELSERDNEVRSEVIEECNKKLDELERNYKSCYGSEIIEMYADVYEDFRKWLKEQR